MPRKGLVFRRVQATDAGLCQRHRGEVHLLDDVGRQEVDGAARVVTARWSQVAKKTNDDALKIFKKAIENVKPLLEVKTRRVGGANYQVPVEVNPFRRQSLAIRWLLQYSRERAGKTMGGQARG